MGKVSKPVAAAVSVATKCQKLDTKVNPCKNQLRESG